MTRQRRGAYQPGGNARTGRVRVPCYACKGGGFLRPCRGGSTIRKPRRCLGLRPAGAFSAGNQRWQNPNSRVLRLGYLDMASSPSTQALNGRPAGREHPSPILPRGGKIGHAGNGRSRAPLNAAPVTLALLVGSQATERTAATLNSKSSQWCSISASRNIAEVLAKPNAYCH